MKPPVIAAITRVGMIDFAGLLAPKTSAEVMSVVAAIQTNSGAHPLHQWMWKCLFSLIISQLVQYRHGRYRTLFGFGLLEQQP